MQAPQYIPSTSFAQDELANVGGRSTVRTDRLDAELANASTSINALQENLGLIQRDDGRLRDGVVEPSSLSGTTRALVQGSRFNPRGLWAPAMPYAVGDLVDYLGDAYVCAIAHTSATFAADYAAGRWQIFTAAPSASSVVFSPAGSVASTNAQAAIEEVAADAAAASQPLQSVLYGAL